MAPPAANKRPTAWLDIRANDGPATKGIKRVVGSLKGLGVAAAGGAAAVAAGGVALAAMSLRALAAADSVGKLGARVGMTAEQVSGLQFAAERGGASAEDMADALKTATLVAGNTPENFRKIGISVRDMSGAMKPTRVLMGEVADKIKGAGSAAEKAAIANAAFGEVGVKLIPMLTDGAAGLEAMEAEAKRLGLTIDDVESRSAATLADRFGILDKQATAVQQVLGSVLAPAVEAIGEGLSTVAGNTIAWVRENRAFLQSRIIDVLQWMASNIIPALAVGVSLVVKAWYGMGMALDVVKLAFSTWYKAVAGGLESLFGTLSKVAKFAGADGVGNALQGLAEGAAGMGQWFGDAGDNAAQGLLQANNELRETEAAVERIAVRASAGLQQIAVRTAELGRSFAEGASGAVAGAAGGPPAGGASGGASGTGGGRVGGLLSAMFDARSRALDMEMADIQSRDALLVEQQRATAQTIADNWGWAGEGIRGAVGGISNAIVEGLTGGGSVTKAIGGVLTSMGTMLVQTALTALAINALGVIPAMIPIVGAPGMAAAPAAVALVVGAGMIALGKAMGGSGGSKSGSVPSSSAGGGGSRIRTSDVRPDTMLGGAGGGPGSVVYINFNRPVSNPRRTAREFAAALGGV